MSVYQTTPEGVAQLEGLSETITNSVDDILDSSTIIKNALGSHSEDLGESYDGLVEAIDNIHKCIDDSTESADEVKRKLIILIDSYNNAIDRQRRRFVDADSEDSTKSKGAKTLRR
ncbi:hypothetical protein [Eubacterium sp.]